MVLIVPPEGWVSAHATELAAKGTSAIPRTGPPPITKISQTFLSLDIVPEEIIGWPQLLNRWMQSKVVWAGMAVSVCLVGILIWALSGSSPKTELAQADADLTTVEKTASVGKTNSPENQSPITPESSVPTPIAAAPAEAKRVGPKPIETQIVEAKPLDTKAGPKPLEPKPEEMKTVEAKPLEGKPVDVAPIAEPVMPPIAEVAVAQPKDPGSPPLPVEAKIHPMAIDDSPPLPATAAKLVKQVAPQAINVDARMDDIIPSLELKDVPFVQALAIASSVGSVPITLDADALHWQGGGPRDLISVRAKDVTLEKLLEEIAGQCGLSVEIEKGHVVITAPAEETEKLRSVPYTVSDLCEKGMDSADLAELLQKFVAPDTWQTRGGQGSVVDEGGSLTIEQTGLVHREIVMFCEKLRLARGLSLKSKIDVKRLPLSSAYEQAKPFLEKRISANFHEPTTLADILAGLASRSGAEILLDRRSLAAAGMSEKMEVSYTAVKQPLETVLDELLRPLKLSYRVIDAGTIQIATQKDLDRHMEWEIYPAGKLASEANGADVVLRLKQSVAPASWTTRGLIYYDRQSKSILVSQSPAVQAAIFRYLAEKAK